MVDGLSFKPYGTGIRKKSFVQNNPAFQETGTDQLDFAEQRRREIEEAQLKRQAEQQAQYEAYMQEFDNAWNRIYGLEKKMEWLSDKIRKAVDPTKMENEVSRLSKMKWKINELYNGSMLTIGNALSTVLNR